MTTRQLLKYLKENEFDIQSATCCHFAVDFYFQAYADSKLFSKSLSPGFCYLETQNNTIPFYEIYAKGTLNEFMREIYYGYLKDPSDLFAKIKKRDQIHRRIEKLCRKFQHKNQQGFSSIASFVSNLLALMRPWVDYAAIGEDKWQIIDNEFVPAFAKKNKISEVEAKNILAIISQPATISVFGRERKSFLSMCLLILQRPLIEKALAGKKYSDALSNHFLNQKINDYIKNYYWIKTDFYSATEVTPQLLLADMAKEISIKDKKAIVAELRSIDENVARARREKKKISLRLNMTRLDQRVFKLSELAVAWHDQRKEQMMKQFYYVFLSLAKLAKICKVHYGQLATLTYDELILFLRTKKLNYKKTQKFFILFKAGQKPQYFVGSVVDRMLQAALKTESKKEIKGTVACRAEGGIIKGIARIVNNPEKDKFGNNEILVTSMTRVEFVPLMRRAKAIITDEGGIACHAAIVSRELSIPCIIGTKIATKVLKDGDLVEVDAEKGVVKILK